MYFYIAFGKIPNYYTVLFCVLKTIFKIYVLWNYYSNNYSRKISLKYKKKSKAICVVHKN